MTTALVRWLLAVARRMCDESTLTNIIEPLLADLQNELATARTPAEYRAVRRRGAAAFGSTLAFCSARRLWRSIGHASPMSVLVGVYSVGMVLVAVYGFTWVRTGEWSASHGVITLRYLSGMFGPLGLNWLFKRAWGQPRRRVMIAAFLLSTVACLLIVPGNRLLDLGINLFVLAILLIPPTRRERARAIEAR